MKLSVKQQSIFLGAHYCKVFIQLFSFALVLTVSIFTNAQTYPAGVTPDLIEKFKSLSPGEKRLLAEQYGVEGSAGIGSPPINGSLLASPGADLASPLENQGVLPSSKNTPNDLVESANVRYGRFLFRRDVSTFAPTDDAPVPDTYRLGVGDQLVVQLFGKENEIYSLQIDRSGGVNFPRLGALTLLGLTFEDARALIKTRIAQQLIGVEVVVSLGRLRAINIFMSGEVAVPGAYSVSALTTVTQALFQAGGVSDIGSLREIQVLRSGVVVTTFDTYDLLMRGDVSRDIRLQSGDVIFVPPYTGLVELEGEFKRPMTYEILGNETIGEVVRMAGSFTEKAFPTSSVLIRQANEFGYPEAITIDLNDPLVMKGDVKSGDVIRVPNKSEHVANSITLTGAFTRPGSYGWTGGLTFSQVVSNLRGDLNKDADLNYGLIVRERNAALDVDVLHFNVADALNNPGSELDPPLEEYDEVVVFKLQKKTSDNEDYSNSREIIMAPILDRLQSQARDGVPVQTVEIAGAVRAPGVYPLSKGATVAVLLDAAGGLLDSAYTKSAELLRVSPSANGELRQRYIELDLSKDYEGKNGDFPLKSRDHLTVREIPDWSPNDSVKVEGEVKFPGEYRVQKGETLSDLIRRAGGFTPTAYAEGAEFTRPAIAQMESERAEEFAQEIQEVYVARFLTEETKSQTIADLSSIVSLLKEAEGSGRLVIDLVAAIEGDSAADIEVVGGDTLRIPRLSNTVAVVGEGHKPGTHTYVEDFTLDDYIQLSAGLTPRADSKAIYIIRANGSVVTTKSSLLQFSNDAQRLYPDDTIVVPINSQYKDSLANWQEITQIVYQSMVSLAAVLRL